MVRSGIGGGAEDGLWQSTTWMRRRRWREAFLMMVARKAVVMMFSSAINILPQTERELGKSDMGSKSG